MSLPEPLRFAIEHLRAERLEPARQLLIDYLRDNPHSDAAWYLLSFALEDRAKQVECLQRCLRINSNHNRARQRLSQLEAAASTGRAPAPKRRTSAVPATGAAPAGRPERRAAPSSGHRLSRRSKILLAVSGIVITVLGIGGGILFLSYLANSMTGQRIAMATSQAATAEFRETTGAAVGLPPTWTPTLTPTASSTPTVTPTPSLTPTPTPVPPDPTTAAEMDIINEQVADIRGLAVADHSESYVITSTKVRPILEASFRIGGGTEAEVADQSRTLQALGLIKPTYDLYTNILNGLTDSLGGFYLPWTEQIFVIGSRFSGIERWVYSHEYGHALVDAHYDIGSAGVYPLCELTEDQCNAIQALVEGDATLVMTQWWLQYAGPQDYDDILRYNPPHRTLPDQYPPPYSLPDSSFPYEQGLAFVEFLHQRGNWAEVNKAYGRLPQSTEQILHPSKYLANEGPVAVVAADLSPFLGEEWRKLEQNTLGEWTTYLMLAYGADLASQIDLRQAELAAEGWGGDTYLVYYHDQDDETVMAARWLWESQTHASEFSGALAEVLEGRYRGGGIDLGRGSCWQANEEVSCMLKAGGETLWLLGPGTESMEALFGAFPAFQ